MSDEAEDHARKALALLADAERAWVRYPHSGKGESVALSQRASAHLAAAEYLNTWGPLPAPETGEQDQ